jgi:hypothetical protein
MEAKENKAMKYFNTYSEVVNYLEKELMYYRAKAQQMQQKKKLKAFQEISDKGIADNLIESFKERAEYYEQRIKEIKEVFNSKENVGDYKEQQIQRAYGRLALHSGFSGLIDNLKVGGYGSTFQKASEVLKMRFGITNGRAMTLEEVGKEFGVTRERIRQVESSALKKLKSKLKK